MESPRKFNDCYFYYYSTCTKGDNCVFRHEPSALGCETMCTAWQQGKCLDKCCKLRHMELRKNRKQIPCYWENQPGGCRKKHCPFMHKNPDARTDGIAPSQPAPIVSAQANVPEVEAGAMNPTVPVPAVPAPAPASVPLLWQQQRQQVVLDSAILGVLPTNELLPRRVVTHAHAHAHPHAHAHAHAHPHAHAHAHPHEPYPSLPVDPLVVNFEEESDNESAPSSTPTKADHHPPHHDELALLARIQAEAAKLYAYDAPVPQPVQEEVTPKPVEARKSLDFKVLSLDEIRARKKLSETIIHTTPITLNLNRKRKLSTHETLTTSGNKIIKVVRSNSIVYKKLDKNTPAQNNQAKIEAKRAEDVSRKRTLSEQSDIIYDIHEDELVDNCYEFKRIKIAEIPKPRLVRNRTATKSVSESKDDENVSKNDDSDTEVQFVSIDLESKIDDDVIDLETTKLGDPVDIVDLCEEQDEVPNPNLDLDLVKNVPDVVASCQKNNKNDKELLNDIDAFLNEEL